MICFHFTTFAVLETAFSSKLFFTLCCDLLSFYYLCRTGNSRPGCGPCSSRVVICFHFTTFAVLETATCHWPQCKSVLWFAFILLPLPYWKQQFAISRRIASGCDLLSFYYLCRTGNSPYRTYNNQGQVVICFHFTTFAVLETAGGRRDLHEEGCDLLSFYYLCRTGNSRIHIIGCISVRYKDNGNTKNVVLVRM